MKNVIATITVPSYAMAKVEYHNELLAKRAAKLGLEAPTFEIVNTIMRTAKAKYVDMHGFDVDPQEEQCFVIEVTGEMPAFKGWAFTGMIDHRENLIYSHRNDLGAYLEECKCDHCGSKRKRKTTYIINKDNEEMQVGGTCLDYYIPKKDLRQVAAFLELVKQYDDLGGEEDRETFGNSFPLSYDLTDVLTWSGRVVETFGKYESGAVGTKLDVMQCIHGRSKEDAEFRNSLKNIDDNYVSELIDYVLHNEEQEGYMANIRQIAKNGYVTDRSMGLAVSMVAAYNRHLDKIKEAEKTSESQYFGEVKKRYEMEVTLDKLIITEGYYGATFIHRFIDDAGNVFMWFGSKELDAEKGDKIKIKATVKGHDEYKGTKQTVVTRVAMVK